MSGGEVATITKVVPGAVSAGFKLWRWRHPDTSPTTLRKQADDLADLVKKTETTRLEQLGVVAQDAEIGLSFDVPGRAHSGTMAEVGMFYRTEPTRRLVILGGAGAGKTVTAIELLLDILEHRPEGGVPVPVRVNASRWDSKTTDVDACLTKVLATDYHLNAAIAAALVNSRRILPVLDGLDEIDPIGQEPLEARRLLDELNEPPWRSQPVIVICRTDTYELARGLRPAGDAGLHAATTVRLRDLTTPEVQEYLGKYRKNTGIAETQWAPVTDALAAHPDGALATALHTPWLLTLTVAHLKKHGRAGAEDVVRAGDPDALEQVLFASMIPTAVTGSVLHKHRRRYNPQKVHRWLHQLALAGQRIQARHGTDIALDEIWQLSPQRCWTTHILLAGVVLATVFGVAGWIARNIPHIMPWGLPASVVGTFAFAMVSGLRRNIPARRTTYSGIFRDPRSWLISLGLGSLLGGAYGLINGVEATRIFGLASGVGLAMLNLCVGTLLFGIIIRFVFFPPPARPRLDERAVIRDDLRVGGTLAAITMLPAAVGMALAYRLAFHLPAAMVARLIPVMLVSMFTVVLFVSAATMRYLCAKAVFVLGSDFSSNPAAFLEWAREAGLLRITGEAYQFRHHTFQQWLLDHPPAGYRARRPHQQPTVQTHGMRARVTTIVARLHRLLTRLTSSYRDNDHAR